MWRTANEKLGPNVCVDDDEEDDDDATVACRRFSLLRSCSRACVCVCVDVKRTAREYKRTVRTHAVKCSTRYLSTHLRTTFMQCHEAYVRTSGGKSTHYVEHISVRWRGTVEEKRTGAKSRCCDGNDGGVFNCAHMVNKLSTTSRVPQHGE